MHKMPGSNIPASWRQSSADRHVVLVQATHSAKRGINMFSLVSEWRETLSKQKLFVSCFRVKGNPLKTKTVWLWYFKRVAVENLKSKRICSVRGEILKLTLNWFEIILTGVVGTISRKFHAGIVTPSKDIPIFIMHSFFCWTIYYYCCYCYCHCYSHCYHYYYYCYYYYFYYYHCHYHYHYHYYYHYYYNYYYYFYHILSFQQ